MSFFNKAGSFTGTTAANIFEGSRLASTQFAQGAKAGYTTRAQELRAQREALGIKATPIEAPAPTKQRKLASA